MQSNQYSSLIIEFNEEAQSYLGWQPGANTLLYVPMETDLLDHSWNNVSITNYWISLNNTVLQNMGVWFFRGSSEDRLEFSWIPFWNNSFTISWLDRTNSNSNGTGSRFSTAWTSWNWAWLLLWYQRVNLYAWNWTSWNVLSWPTAFSSTTNKWVHRVITRDWNTWKTYKNGSLFWSGTASGYVWYNTEVIGNYRPWDRNPFYGYMSQFIIENKVRSQLDVQDYLDKIKNKYWIS